MPLQLTGRHMTITDEHKQFIDRKVNRLRRLCPKIDEMRFTLSKEKLNYQADGTFRAGRLSLNATVTDSQPLAAIDALIDKLEHQIAKSKERLDDRKKVTRARTEEEVAETEEEIGEEFEEAEMVEPDRPAMGA